MTDAPHDRADAIYVGYLPLPKRHAKLLRIALPVASWLVLMSAALAAWGMRSGGDGQWDFLIATAEPTELSGTAVGLPYAAVLLDPQSPGDLPETVLVVEQGKFGSQPRLLPREGGRVTVRGFMLERDGRRMIELMSGEDAVVLHEGTDDPKWAPPIDIPSVEGRIRGTVVLRGELMDGKCHLGAMRPGDGKGHKACAILCISGGIPPLLRVVDDAGTVEFLLVVGPTGAPCPPDVVALAGEPIEITGELGHLGDLTVLHVIEGAAQRLGPALAEASTADDPTAVSRATVPSPASPASAPSADHRPAAMIQESSDA